MNAASDANKDNGGGRWAAGILATIAVLAIAGWVVWKFSLPAGAPSAVDRMAEAADETSKVADSSRVALADPPTYGRDDWPSWRGAAGDNFAPDVQTANAWSKTENVKWHAALPGRGHSTPIVVGDRVIVTTAEENENRVLAIALDKNTGKEIWRKTVGEGKFRAIHQFNSHATATPASDGKNVYVALLLENTISLAALSLDGQELWTTVCGPCTAKWGLSGSPSLWRGLIYVAVDNPDGGWIAAYRANDGKRVWLQKRAQAQEGSYSSPIVATIDGVPQVIIVGAESITAYDPQSGAILWTHEGIPSVSVSTAIVAGDLCIASAGWPSYKLICLRLKRAAGSKMMTAKVLWETEKSSETPYIPTPVLHNGTLYIAQDQGILMSRDATSGDIGWKRRLSGNINASPLFVGDKLLVSNDAGVNWLIDPASGDIVAENSLPAGMHASPIASGRDLLLRTDEDLYCIAAGE